MSFTASPLKRCLVAAVAVFMAGCPAPGPDLVVGEGGIYDFGPVFLGGEAVTRSIIVDNRGGTSVRLIALERSDGEPVTVSEVGDEDALFQVAFSPVELESGETAVFDATFRPLLSAGLADHSTTLVFRAEGVAEPVATVTLKARTIGGLCLGVGDLDFGKVLIGETALGEFILHNPMQVPHTVNVGAIEAAIGGDGAFSFAPNSPRGDVTIEPGSQRKVQIQFAPTSVQDYAAALSVQLDPGCGLDEVALSGTGVDHLLSWDPAQIDCGFVAPGATVEKEVTFTNDSRADVELSQISTTNKTEFSIVATGAQPDPTRLTVPAEGTAVMTVACRPAVLGPRQALLHFDTSLPQRPDGQITVKLFGGGPDIDVAPTLDFGKVAYFASASPPSFTIRQLKVRNVGAHPESADPAANLHLDPSSFVLSPLNGATAPGEFQVSLPATYDEEVGVEAIAGKNELALRVTLTPTSLGVKQAELRIFSNDPDEPAVSVTLMAEVADLPACDYSVWPSGGLDFGRIPGGESRELRFAIQNRGTNAGDLCLISAVALAPGADPAFSLVDGEIDSFELAPGAFKTIGVRVKPEGPTPTSRTTLSGAIDFAVSSPVTPAVSVPLTAQVGPSCVVVAPNNFDFGTVEIGCRSPARTVSVYNACSAPVTFDFVSMAAAAGQPAGGANCPGTTDCPEFFIVQSPAIPPGGLVLNPGTPATLQVKYKPIDVGDDLGAIAVSVTENGVSAQHLANLRGAGAIQGIQTDRFEGAAKPKADLLFVIDTSPGMLADQQRLANPPAFFQYALSQQVDFHIASISADLGAAGAGELSTGSLHPTQLVSGTGATAEAQFEAKIELGENGSTDQEIAEAMVLALSAPLSNSVNAGFLREDASLGVIALTVGPDASPRTTAYYLDRLWNAKAWRRNLVSFSAIAAFSETCQQARGTGDSGELAYYAAQTGGRTLDLCASGLSAAAVDLTDIGFGFRTDYFLTEVPDPSAASITVQIDGAVIDPVDTRGATIWTFDAIANAVHFEPLYAPEPGQVLTITYPVACLP